MKYNSGLDGLRAVAVAAVVTTHTGLTKQAGYQGVTVFFVISGYLITTLLVAELSATGELRVAAFYRRRIARLGPALVLSCAVTTSYLLVTQSPVRTWGVGLLSALTYTTDFVDSFTSGSHIGLFEPTWTLAVEEQFYLVWPAILMLCWRSHRPTRNLQLTCGVLYVASWLNRARFEAGTPSHNRLFHSLDAHADALLLGCLLAAVFAGRDVATTRWRLGACAVGCAGVLGLLIVYFHPSSLGMVSFDRVGFGQVALASGAVLSWLVVSPDGFSGRLLGLAPLAYVGRLSYGIYLYNLLLARIFERAFGTLPFHSAYGVGYAVTVLAVAAASYRFVETPLRRAWSGRPTGRLREAGPAAPVPASLAP